MSKIKDVLVYWSGIVGVPGKGPNYSEKYNPDTTIGSIITKMNTLGLGERKRIEILKFKGSISNYEKNNPYWSHTTKLSEIVEYNNSDYLMLIYVIVA